MGSGSLLTFGVSVESRPKLISSSQSDSVVSAGVAESDGPPSQQQAESKKRMRSLFLKVFQICVELIYRIERKNDLSLALAL